MTTSAESARQNPVGDKIEFSCSCGKKYRVPASRAGKQVRCRNCRLKVRVPGDANISLRTRKAILGELGIDAEQAAQKFEAEQKKSYVCSLCAADIAEEELGASYGEDGLVCATCRAAAVEQRGGEAQKKPKRIEKWSRAGSVEAATKKSRAYGALFFLGTAGFVHSIFAAPVLVTLGVAGVVAAVGARAIFKAYEPQPEQPTKK
jgi:predicted SprT family Zn-dependent metalloprotease